MKVGWLKKVLDRFDDDNADIFIYINGQKHNLCGRVDKLILTFERMDDPGVTHGENALCLHPCKCRNEKEDQMVGEKTINPN